MKPLAGGVAEATDEVLDEALEVRAECIARREGGSPERNHSI
jgi:hypothetical protein